MNEITTVGLPELRGVELDICVGRVVRRVARCRIRHDVNGKPILKPILTLS